MIEPLEQSAVVSSLSATPPTASLNVSYIGHGMKVSTYPFLAIFGIALSIVLPNVAIHIFSLCVLIFC